MWIPVVMISILALAMLVTLGPLLKVLGVVEWQWKFILAPLWVPLLVLLVWLTGWALFLGAFAWLLRFFQ